MLRFPRLVIAGTQSGVGKTTVALGLMAILSRQLQVQPYKIGPDYIDSAYHTFITGRKSRNLDGWLLSEEALVHLFRKNTAGANLAIIEGVMGLYDGAQTGGAAGSTAQVAKMLRAPVILVVDGSGMSTSSAAMVKGYQDFDRDLDLAGVILNRVSGERHYQLLKEAIETHTGVRVFGYLPKDLEVELPSRHLGLVPSGEISSLRDKVAKLADLMARTVEIAELYAYAQAWEPGVPNTKFSLEPLYEPKTIPLAVAYDEAFNFYYWDNLELLEELGARLELFSPRKDRNMPRGVGGLLLGGGFPEVFAQELQDNREMRQSVWQSLQGGLPYSAECGGLMYLLEKLSDCQGQEFEMVGWLQGTCQMTTRLQHFGYAEMELIKDSIYGPAQQRIRVHEFHRSIVQSKEPVRAFLLHKERVGLPTKQWECGYQKGAGVAGYAHLHYYANPLWARNFLQAAACYLGKNVACGESKLRAGRGTDVR